MATTGILAALQPELAANATLQQELVSTINREMGTASDNHSTTETIRSRPQALPTPPDLKRHNTFTSPETLIGLGVFTLVGLVIKLGNTNNWLGPLIAKGFSSGTISGLLAACFFFGGFRLLRLNRLIQDTPTSKIRSIAMGCVEVHGKALRQYALFSPMTNIACIYYRLVRYKRNAKNDWVVSSITSSGHVPFWIEDDTGRVSVDPAAATVKASHRQESLGEGTTAFGGFSSADEKWVEEMIYDGALVYVLGEAQVKKPARASRQQRRAEALRRIKQDAQKLATYDTDKDGKIDEREWQLARDEVDEQLLHEDLMDSNEARRQEDQVVIAKPRQRGLPFVIAETASEKNLTSRNNLATGFFFAAASLCSALSIWLLLQNLR
jgi:hypothetical protein